MKKSYVLFLGLLLLGLSFATNAATIEITQTFHDTNLVLQVNGSDQAVTGDWIFKGTTNTNAVDQSGFTNRGHYATTVKLTQASLGLFDVVVTNMDTLFIIHDSNAVYQGLIGFSNGGFAPYARTESSFSNPDLFPSISELTIAQGTSTFNSLGAFVAGYHLEDGTVIAATTTTDFIGIVHPDTYDGLITSMNAQVVPVPAAVWLFGSGLIGLIGVARRK